AARELHAFPTRRSSELERIANFEAPRSEPLVPALGDGLAESPEMERSLVAAVSINDLRKNLRAINEHMATECKASAGRYGIELRSEEHTSELQSRDNLV